MSTVECTPLLDACTMRVYADNCFRVLGVPVDVSPRRLKRRSGDLQAAIEVGELEAEYTHALKPDPLPTPEAIRQAGRQLQDPVSRFVHEFFWFWPMEWGKSGSDEGLQALERGGAAEARRVWVPVLKNGDREHALIAKHNLAVLWHLSAMDGEMRILENGSENGSIPPDHREQTNSCWQHSFKHWESLCKDEIWWSFVTERVRKVEDPTLTTGFVRRFRDALPIGFDNINADIATELARQGDHKRARMHISIMEQTNQGDDDLEVNFRQIRKPLYDRIENAVKRATENLQSHKREGLARAVTLAQGAKEPLRLLAVLLKKHDPSEYAEAADQVAEAVLECLIAYGNETKDLRKSKAVLTNALKLACSPQLKQRIQGNIDTLDEMLKTGLFDLSEEDRQLVEDAQQAAGREDWDTAVDWLKLVCDHLGPKTPAQVKKNLSICLTNRGISKINQAMQLINMGMQEFQRMLERLTPAHGGGFLLPVCGMCGGQLFGTGTNSATISLPNGGTSLLCYPCVEKLKRLQERGRPNWQETAQLKAGATDLAEALRHDPSNEHARTNLAQANSILTQFGASAVTAPSAATPRKASSPSSRAKPGQAASVPRWIVWLVIIGILMIISALQRGCS